MGKRIGENFYNELLAGGIENFRFSWCSDGSFIFNHEVTEEQKAEVLSVYEAHDPNKEPESTQGEK